MRFCPNCKYPNPDDRTICEACDTVLEQPTSAHGSNGNGNTAPGVTKALDPSIVQNHPILAGFTSGAKEKSFLRLEIFGEVEPLIVPLKKEIIFGRRDPALPKQPDVDLSPYAGYRMGVSRSHAKLTRNAEGHLLLADLGSSNGTFLNDTRLDYHQSYKVNDGDLIALGQMVIQIFYTEEKDKPASPPPSEPQST